MNPAPMDSLDRACLDFDEMSSALRVRRQAFLLFNNLPSGGDVLQVNQRISPLALIPLWSSGELCAYPDMPGVSYQDKDTWAINGIIIFTRLMAPMPTTEAMLAFLKEKFPHIWMRRELELQS